MTLPRLLILTLNRRFNDDSLCHVYALEGHSVECASDSRHLLLTMSAADGFEITFAISLLATDLVDGCELLETSEPVRPN